jgi:hypothetical protein
MGTIVASGADIHICLFEIHFRNKPRHCIPGSIVFYVL